MSDESLNKWGQPPVGRKKSCAMSLHGEYIGLLIANEEATRDLYRMYGEKVRGAGHFWERMAKEEQAHANVLRKIATAIESGDMSFSRPDEFHLPNIADSIEWTRNRILDVADRPVKMREALTVALSAEKTMVEGRFFVIIDDDDDRIKQEFAMLEQHTMKHFRRLKRQSWHLKWLFLG